MLVRLKKTAIIVLAALSLTATNAYSQNTSKETDVVNNMLKAFGAGDMEALKATISDSSVWIYEGSSDIPYTGVYKGKEGAVQFITDIVSNVDVLDFQVKQLLAHGNTVVVLGSEKQKIKKNGQILEQNWVQVYTVEGGLITKMEEFANTSHAEKLFNTKE
ncbi:hypothetical protein CLV62_101242 [Dysgonomonas alginatilytica]|uniref:SnoaL-like domain-containing protein n=1 Tax=Dysgonomonas alginatilytica TaxID=1605892 RepID=A0A2V3PVP2_9BACT|nr:nuclear transport factor 2 family protein [Dysgonomonas alginatilytica]PXV68976.1 hypothetical protein CLV62_101242 [Dysgonomonas alginatilytica]